MARRNKWLPWRSVETLTANNERVYAIGDIHGSLDAYVALKRRIEQDSIDRQNGATRVRLIVLGDFIDRGPAVRQVVRTLMKHEQNNQTFEVLLGNHEELLLQILMGKPGLVESWLEFGGLQTIASFGVAPPRPGENSFEFAERLGAGLGAEVVEWLQSLSCSATSGDYLFCHAGVRPGVPLRKQSIEDMLWIRDEFTQSTKWHGARIVHGHSPVSEVNVLPNRIAVDTGAYRSGVLSAVGLQDSRIWTITSA